MELGVLGLIELDCQSGDATTATVLHGYTLLRRHISRGTSMDAQVDWQFALARGPHTTFYCCADTGQQLDRSLVLRMSPPMQWRLAPALQVNWENPTS